MSRNPRRLAVCAAVLVTVTAAGLPALANDGGGGNGGGASSADGATTVLHLVARSTSFHSTGGKTTKAGDLFTFADALSRNGTPVGTDHCFCAAVNGDDLVCDGVLGIGGGSVTFTQPFRNSTLRGTGAITGGTGQWTGASGTFTAVGRPGTDPQVYDYTLRISRPN